MGGPAPTSGLNTRAVSKSQRRKRPQDSDVKNVLSFSAMSSGSSSGKKVTSIRGFTLELISPVAPYCERSACHVVSVIDPKSTCQAEFQLFPLWHGTASLGSIQG